MYVDLSQLFHRSSKDTSGGGSVNIAKDSSKWPHEWGVVHLKKYPRFRTIALPNEKPSADFFDLIENRVSERNFSGATIPINKLSSLLKYSAGIVAQEPGASHRAYPSGGARYPIEMYPVILKGGEVQSGVYHYNVAEHGLDVLWQREFSKEDISKLSRYEWIQQASMLLVMTIMFDRVQGKYGERGYRYALFEAGHIAQNVCLCAQAENLRACPVGGMRDTYLEKLLDIDGTTESVLYAVAIG